MSEFPRHPPGEGEQTRILLRADGTASPPRREYTAQYKSDLIRRLALCTEAAETATLLAAEGLQQDLVDRWQREFSSWQAGLEPPATRSVSRSAELGPADSAEVPKGRPRTVVTSTSKITGREPGKEACLVVIYGNELGKKHILDAATLVLGRSVKCDVQIDQESVSRAHSKITNNGKSIAIRELGSTNGTYVNDELVETRVLGDGDLIKIGRTIFKFLSGGNIERAYHEEIYRLTVIDPLTQIYNRRYFMETLERELARSNRYTRDMTLLALVPDKLDSVWNVDQEEAEDLLKAFASELKTCIRREDVVARYSDRVLVGVLPEIDAFTARSFCQGLVLRLTRSQHPVLARSTMSIGLAGLTELRDSASPLKDVLRRLDAAKRLGGNRIVDYPVSAQEDPLNTLQSTFISYGGPDEAFARKLNDALKIQGVQTFFFHDDAPPGDKLHDVMRTGVNEHDRVILVCSQNSLERPGLLTELEETLARESRDGGAT